VKVITIKLNLPQFDAENISFADTIFRHISEELAMFNYPTPTKWPLYRDNRKVGEVKVKEKSERHSKDLAAKSAQQT
jgi:hypothetical protein